MVSVVKSVDNIYLVKNNFLTGVLFNYSPKLFDSWGVDILKHQGRQTLGISGMQPRELEPRRVAPTSHSI
ncbi:hypothetical protein J36TS2_37110 [Bacillus paralicheniformis]|nr:hypothetical protein BaLi_c05980 [Bacillus paralicheniformis ATCC 9945a]GIN54817.1 hypothetical protein J36TS2_37110 [Bacillus paralicheniformis]